MTSFTEWCIANNKENYLAEWDLEANGDLRPESLPYGSGKYQIHWKCSLGHTWTAKLNNRTSKKNNSCPYCRGRMAWPGFNDLATLRPDLAVEWNQTLNDKSPSEVVLGCNDKVWWICSLGHSYPAKINDRTKKNGTGCPYCSGQKVLRGFNDLESKFPEIAKQWDYSRNKLKPYEVAPRSNKLAYWICDKGHGYPARISDRVHGNGCPYCAGKKVLAGFNDLATLRPDLAAEWDYKKNGDLLPSQVTIGQSKEVYWKCKYGHSWPAKIYARKKNGCPDCAGQRVIPGNNDLATKCPTLLKEWNWDKNKDISPDKIMPSSGVDVWWKCHKGHEWMASPNERNYGRRKCPECSNQLATSFPEQAILYYLTQCGYQCRNRYREGSIEIDILIPQIGIGIEYDGVYFHSSEAAKKRGLKKDKYCQENHIDLLRIKETYNLVTDQEKCWYRFLPDRSGVALDRIIQRLISYCNACSGKKISIDVNTDRDSVSIWSEYMLLAKKNSLANKYPEIAKQWDYQKNGTLTPELVSFGTNAKVGWICPKGHHYTASISKRTHDGTGCPYCSGQKVLFGLNDLATLRPDLAAEWSDKNTSKPSEYTEHSGKKVMWICPKGHPDYPASINKRSIGRGCPICGIEKRRITRRLNSAATSK